MTGGASPPTASWQGTRTRSIWWNQLVLGASVVVILMVMLTVTPEYFATWPLIGGAAGICVCTIVVLAVPWAGLPLVTVLAVPFFDLVCIAVMSGSTDLRLGFLWAFPVMWIASHASLKALSFALIAIATALGIMVVAQPTPVSLIRLTIVLVTLLFIGITAYASSRRNRAFRRLLRAQAARHRGTSLRVAEDERRIVELTNAVDDGIARIGRDGRLVFVNDAYARMYGIDRSDLTQPPRSVDYEESGATPVAETARPLVRARSGEVFADQRVWVYDSDGQWRALSLTSKRLGSAGRDATAAMFLIARDITDVLTAQREREQLTAMATHEMRHPLTAIVGNAELALDFDQLTPTTRERLEVIHSSSERLNELVGEFLHRSKRPGPQAETSAAFDLRSIVTASVQSFEAAAAAGEVTVHVELDEALPVVADAFRLRQVVDNLVSNAIKYTGEGGTVIVAGLLRDGRVVVTVSDTGIGMSAADVAQIFDPYFRSSAAEDFAPGTGLGMGIARDLLALQGGTLSVDSRLRAGTTVTVDLPATSSRVAGGERFGAGAASAGAGAAGPGAAGPGADGWGVADPAA